MQIHLESLAPFRHRVLRGALPQQNSWYSIIWCTVFWHRTSKTTHRSENMSSQAPWLFHNVAQIFWETLSIFGCSQSATLDTLPAVAFRHLWPEYFSQRTNRRSASLDPHQFGLTQDDSHHKGRRAKQTSHLDPLIQHTRHGSGSRKILMTMIIPDTRSSLRSSVPDWKESSLHHQRLINQGSKTHHALHKCTWSQRFAFVYIKQISHKSICSHM